MEAVSLDSGARFRVEDLLNFTLDAAEEDVDNEKPIKSPSFSSSNSKRQDPDHQSLPLPEFAEEELEWLSNKDAFPAVETFLDILSDNPGIVLNHQSPVSVLENSNSSSSSSTSTSNNSTITSCCGGSILVPVGYPVKARSKRRRRHRRGFSDLPSFKCWWWNQANLKQQVLPIAPTPSNATTIGRRCQHCLAEKTPQWRAGPMGPKTLCNACGVRYKSGRLVPEYRPASSPTFSSLLHSNSHRKIVEMRRQQQEGGRKPVDMGG